MPCEEISSATAFAPGHITGFFEIHDHTNPIMKGSTGCGIVLDAGIKTTVSCTDEVEKTEIILNDKNTSGDTIRTVIKMLTDRPVKVECQADIPIECGLGASGAGALGTAYALNHALSLDLTANKLNEIAHVAEVKNSSGLGDVAAQSLGGVVMRTSPGAPDIATHDQISSPDYNIYCLVLGKLSTGSVLGNRQQVEKINSAGRESMKQLMKKPTIEKFMHCSRDFAIGTGLADEKIIEIIEAVQSVGGLASQAMLGNTVFALGTNNKSCPNENITEVLTDFGDVLNYRIKPSGIRMM